MSPKFISSGQKCLLIVSLNQPMATLNSLIIMSALSFLWNSSHFSNVCLLMYSLWVTIFPPGMVFAGSQSQLLQAGCPGTPTLNLPHCQSAFHRLLMTAPIDIISDEAFPGVVQGHLYFSSSPGNTLPSMHPNITFSFLLLLPSPHSSQICCGHLAHPRPSLLLLSPD